jgi:hypothetical protein
MSAYKLAFSKMVLRSKIPAGDALWKEFNGSFENMELEPQDIANMIYTGHPFTTWHRNHWRHTNNYELGQHIGIDFDTEDERSTLPYLAKDKFISRYANLIYTTPSHRPETPRARVLFLLDSPIHQTKNYGTAASALLWLFGAADRQCKDAARFFYGSIDCDVEWMPDNVLPLETLKQIIAQYNATGATEKRNRERNYTAPADQQEVADALRRIPPWGIEYDEWLGVLMGLHAEFGDSALGLAESWAAGDDGEVRRKWRSFRNDGNASGRVGVGTVFATAKRFGWGRAI